MAPLAERLFEIAFQRSKEPTIIVQANPPSFTIIASNEQHKIATNYVGKDILGKSLVEVFTPAEEHRKNEFGVLLDGLMESIATRQTVRLPVFRYDMPGNVENTFQEAWWQLEIIPIESQENEVVYLMTTTHNITDEVISKKIGEQIKQQGTALELNQRLNAELERDIAIRTRKLAENELRWSSLFEQSPLAMAVLRGIDMIVESVNDILLGIWGKSNSILGEPILKALPELKGQPFIPLLEKVFLSGETFRGYEMKAVHYVERVMTTRYFDFVYSALRDADGNITGVMVVALDVTARTESRKRELQLEENEKRFRGLLNAIPHIAWTNTINGKVNFYNNQWYNYTGLSEQESTILQWQQIIHPDEATEKMQAYRAILKSRKAGEFEVRKRRADGKYCWHLVRIVPMLDEAGHIKDWLGTATDIHDLKLLQQQKDDFITIASHELKTPITVLSASMQVLNRIKDSISNPMLTKVVEQATKGMDRASILIKNLLDVAKFNQGQVHLNKTRISIGQLLDDCCSHVILKEGFTLNIQGEKDIYLYADADSIEQVMINLIGNAIKYAGDSRIIKVKVERLREVAKISVADSGIGIAKEKIPYLFDRYYRVDERGVQYSGLGLGLYICAEIIKKHGGQIGVDSEIGKGSNFWFTLPLF